jgi:hypothetical protein
MEEEKRIRLAVETDKKWKGLSQLEEQIKSLTRQGAAAQTSLNRTIEGLTTRIRQQGSAVTKAATTAASATKKLATAQRSLMGFDEIQKLSATTTSSGSGGSTAKASNAKGSGTALKKSKADWAEGLRILEALKARFRQAWQEAGNGQKILSALKGLWSDLKATADGMVAATTRWAGSLNFSGVISGTGQLLTQLRPLAALLEGSLAWGYEQVLLPLAKWTIERGTPALLQLLAGAVTLVTGALQVLQPIMSKAWEGFFKPLATWTGNAAVTGLNLLGQALTWAGQQLNGLAATLSAAGDWRTKLTEIGTQLVEGLKTGFRTGLDTAWNGIAGAWQTFTGHFAAIQVQISASIATKWEALREKWKGLTGHFADIRVQISANIATKWGELREKWNSLTSNLKNKTVTFTAKVTTTAESLWQKFKAGWANKSLGLKLTWVTSGLNSIQLALSKTLFSGKGWPKLAFAARGGVFDDPTLTVLGEAGREAVVPLENNTGWMDALARRIAAQMGSTTSGGGQTITVQCLLDGRIVAENTVQYVNQQARRTGVHPMAAYL